MEFPTILWNFQKFGLNLPKKLARILIGSISESSFGKLLPNDVVIPSPLFSRALSPKSGFGKFFYLPQVLSASFFFTCQNYFPISASAFGKRFLQVFYLPKRLSNFGKCFRQVILASFFLLAKTTFPFRQVLLASDSGKLFYLPKRLSEKTFHVWHGLKNAHCPEDNNSKRFY